MHKIKLLGQSDLGDKRRKITFKEDFISFVGIQFKQLKRKNLKLPMQLYHL